MAADAAYDVPAMLARVEPLGADEYIIAYGQGRRCLFGTPNGFSGDDLPDSIVELLVAGSVKTFKSASFGSHVDQWFVCYQAPSGKTMFRLGPDASPMLRNFVDRRFPPYFLGLKKLLPTLRVQFGADGSFIAWNQDHWLSSKIPDSVLSALKDASKSLAHRSTPQRAVGVFLTPLVSITWSTNGSYFAEFLNETLKPSYVWKFYSDITRTSWNRFWDLPQARILSPGGRDELAHGAIYPHSADGDMFVFLKKKSGNLGPDFIMRLAPDDPIVHLTPKPEPAQPKLQQRVQHVGPSQVFREVQSTRDGRSHPTDDWELSVKKGEVLLDLREGANGWNLCQNKKGQKGYVHRSCLDFDYGMHANNLYQDFVKERLTMALPLTTFPNLTGFASLCSEKKCKVTKDDVNGIGICTHALEKILRGSGHYTTDFLKDERKKWHPDSFAKLCHPGNREHLKKQAERLFVFIGMLMDRLVSADAEAAGFTFA